MPRPSNPVPAYRHHRPSGQAVATVRRPDGSRCDVYLGGYISPESKAEYERLLASVRPSPSAAPLVAGSRLRAAPDLSVNEVVVAFLRHAEGSRSPQGLTDAV